MIRSVLFVVVAGIWQTAFAEGDPAALYEQGRRAYESGDCITALQSLYAFQQAAPAGTISPELAQMLPQAIQYCRGKLEFALEEVPRLQAQVRQLGGSTISGREIKGSKLPTTISQAGRPYPLRCRGGGLPVSINGNEARIRFQTSGAASDPNQLQPGHCGWLDRPMDNTEPQMICHRVTSGRASVTVQQGRLSATAPWGYLSRLDDTGAVITLQVANDGRGCMVVNGQPTVMPPTAIIRPDVKVQKIPRPKK